MTALQKLTPAYRPTARELPIKTIPDGPMDAAQLATIIEDLVAAMVTGGAEAFDRRLEELEPETPLEAEEWIVLCAERLQHVPRHRRAILERVGRAIEVLSAVHDAVGTMRGLAVTAQIQLAERLHAEAATVIDLLASYAAKVGSRVYQCGARLLRAHLELERGNAAQAAVDLDALESEIDPEIRKEAPELELSVRTLQVGAHSAVGDFAKLDRALAGLEAALPAPVPFTRYYRGVVAEAHGQLEEARACYSDACSPDGPVDVQVAAQVALARLLPAESEERLATGQALVDGQDLTVEMALARATLRAGRLDQARDLAHTLRQRDREATLLVQAEILAASGPTLVAMERVAELMDLATSRGLTGLRAQAHLLAARLDEAVEARSFHARRAAVLATRCGDRVTLGRARVEQALVEVDLHDGSAALESATAALEIAREVHSADLAASAELALGLAHRERGDETDAEQHLARALAKGRRLGLLGVASRALFGLGRPDDALSLLREAGAETA
jgi:tetratricopeptide (TPR) repeat protein